MIIGQRIPSKTNTPHQGIDVNRHKEIIVKAVSAVLLLLLKHFKGTYLFDIRKMLRVHFDPLVPILVLNTAYRGRQKGVSQVW